MGAKTFRNGQGTGPKAPIDPPRRISPVLSPKFRDKQARAIRALKLAEMRKQAIIEKYKRESELRKESWRREEARRIERLKAEKMRREEEARLKNVPKEDPDISPLIYPLPSGLWVVDYADSTATPSTASSSTATPATTASPTTDVPENLKRKPEYQTIPEDVFVTYPELEFPTTERNIGLYPGIEKEGRYEKGGRGGRDPYPEFRQREMDRLVGNLVDISQQLIALGVDVRWTAKPPVGTRIRGVTMLEGGVLGRPIATTRITPRGPDPDKPEKPEKSDSLVDIGKPGDRKFDLE